MAQLSLIAAMDQHQVIGRNNQLPWHLPADLKWFKKNTMNKPIIMGRKTFESIGKALPGRKNIVITRQENYSAPGCSVVGSLEAAIKEAQNAEEVVVIGGANLYQQALPHANKLYLTVIDHAFKGDAFFPKWDPSMWRLIFKEPHEPDDQHLYPYCFFIYER